jgi:hypothetical protein
MSGAGKSLKRVFEDTLLDLKGVDVFIYENWQSEQMSSIEARAIKERGKQYFEFPVNTRVKKDDVVQIKGSQDFWRVLDSEEDYKYGTAVKLHVRVNKIDESGNEIRLNAEGRAINYTANIQGHNYGGIQQGGQGNTQNVTLTNTNNPNFDTAIKSLVELIQTSVISPEDKDELLTELQNINKLALKDANPALVERAKSKINYFELTANSVALGAKVAPYIPQLINYFETLLK